MLIRLRKLRTTLACFPRAYLLFFLADFFSFPPTTLLPSAWTIAFQPASYLCFNSSPVKRSFWCRLHQHLIQARCVISDSLLWALSAPYLKLPSQVSSFASQCGMSSSRRRVIENDAQPAIQLAHISGTLKLVVHIDNAIHILSWNRYFLSSSCVVANSTVEQLQTTSPAMPTSTP